MKTANQYRQKQILSLTDEIERLQKDISGIRQEKSDWESGKKQREDILTALDQKTAAAQSAHDAKIRLLNSQEEQKTARVKELETMVSNLETWHSHEAAEKSAEMIEEDLKIDAKREVLRSLEGQEIAINDRIAQAKVDEVNALRSAAKAMDENKEATETLAKIKKRIIQAELDWKTGEVARAEEIHALEAWKGRLDIREEDFNIIAERMKPEFTKIFGEMKLNAHIFSHSRPTRI